ncbi:hypothetical protein [Oleomonas cavernae]|uniref:hypothetical protein n=1 Tax=Oleomonas cavernae TaxID=2320859 RepID=UPI0011C4576E|nr:hypothetical protein [Oleomonas cavernae]
MEDGIPFNDMVRPNFHAGVTHDKHAIAKFSNASWGIWKYVSISSNSPNIKKFLPSVYSFSAFVRNAKFYTLQIEIWGDNHENCLVNFRKRKVIGHIYFRDVGINLQLNIYSWRIARIMPCFTKQPEIAICRFIIVLGVNQVHGMDVSSQLSMAAVSSDRNCFVCGFSRLHARSSGYPRENKRYDKATNTKGRYQGLAVGGIGGIASGFRSLPLRAQIGIFAILGAVAVGSITGGCSVSASAPGINGVGDGCG